MESKTFSCFDKICYFCTHHILSYWLIMMGYKEISGIDNRSTLPFVNQTGYLLFFGLFT
ncbi:hypothetical protein M084_0389 [Bacteroides fragilis str. 3988 T1]|nr:hypothetical protein M084_0389 [Bacteroides fragilis str. 3988 T1]